MLRCETCGRRLAESDPRCAVHGARLTPRRDSPPSLGLEAGEDAPPEAIGPYRIVGTLGIGGFAAVFDARSPEDDPVALKVGRGTAGRAILARELRLLELIGGPPAPRVLGVLGAPPEAIAIERLGLPTLARMLEQRPHPAPADALLETSLRLVRAVGAMHERGIWHGDLKPENVFVDPSPTQSPSADPAVRLIDFGLAGPLEDEGPQLSTGAGTAEYVAPEQLEPGNRLDLRVDVYALGALLFELWTGRPPFIGSEAQVRQAQRARRAPPASQFAPVPPDVEAALARCLVKEPADRLPSAAALAELLVSVDVTRAAARPAPARAPASPRPSLAIRKERLALVYVTSSTNLAVAEQAASTLGGVLASAVIGKGFIVVFGHATVENPVRRALLAARSLLRRGLGEHLLVALEPLSVSPRRDGGVRFAGAALSRADRFPTSPLAPGLYLTAEAAAVAGEPTAPLDAPADWCVPLGLPASFADPRTGGSTDVGLMVGRTAELDRLAVSADRALSESTPTVIAVVGEAGQGKSHLLSHLLDRLRARSFRLLRLRAPEPVGEGEGQVLKTLLCTLLELPATLPTAADPIALIRATLPPTALTSDAPAVGYALGWIEATSPSLTALLSAPGALRHALGRIGGEALRRACRDYPLAVLLDDAHWADPTTLDALELGALSEARARLWICALGRPSFLELRPEWGSRSGATEQLRLCALDEAEADQLCRELLLPAREVPARVVSLLVERSRRVPLYLVELLRSLRSAGLVRQDERGGWYVVTELVDRSLDLPLTEWLAARELDGLPPELAAHARLAAILGNDFTLEELSGVLQVLDASGEGEHFPLDAGRAVASLRDAGLLLDRSGGRLSFRHALIREAIDAGAPPALKAVGHRAALTFYRDAERLGDERRLTRLAFHAERAQSMPEALAAHLTLAERRREVHDYLTSERHYHHALALMPLDDSRRAAALQGRGLMRYRLQRYDDAHADFDAALDLAVQRGDVGLQIDVLLDAATSLDWSEDFKRSRACLDRALALAGQVSDPLLDARLTMAQARTAWRFNDDARAAELFSRAAALAQSLGDLAYETKAISLLANGYVLAALGRLAESERAFEAVIPLCEQRGDVLHLASAVGNRLMLWIARNDRVRMLSDLHRMFTLAREMGNARLEQNAEFYRALFLHWRGEPVEAAEASRRAVEIERRRLGNSVRCEAALLHARVLLALDRVAESRELIEDIRARQARARAVNSLEVDLLPAEEVMLSLVDLCTRAEPQDVTLAEWEHLLAIARERLTPLDLLEVLYTMGVQLQRGARNDASRRVLAEGLDLSRRTPNVMHARLEEAHRRARAD